jgi:hypothetical protein
MHTLIGHVLKEVVHDQQQRQLSDDDPITKQHGGTPTHGPNHVTGHTTDPEMPRLVRAATGCHKD